MTLLLLSLRLGEIYDFEEIEVEIQQESDEYISVVYETISFIVDWSSWSKLSLFRNKYGTSSRHFNFLPGYRANDRGNAFKLVLKTPKIIAEKTIMNGNTTMRVREKNWTTPNQAMNICWGDHKDNSIFSLSHTHMPFFKHFLHLIINTLTAVGSRNTLPLLLLMHCLSMHLVLGGTGCIWASIRDLITSTSSQC